MQKNIGYADALKILGEGQSKVLDALDIVLGGTILTATAATGQIGLLELLDARNEIIKQSKKLLSRLAQRVRGATGKGRTDLLVAAHALVAVNAYFEAFGTAFGAADLPSSFKSLQLTGAEKLMLAGGPAFEESIKLTDAILHLPVPIPMPTRSYEEVVNEMRHWYLILSERTLKFINGLAVWDDFNETRQYDLSHLLLKQVPGMATAKYEDDFRKLAVTCPEFKMWVLLTDSAATRTALESLGGNIETSLAGLQNVLEGLAAERQSADWPVQLSNAYRAQLDRPIAETAPGEALAGLIVPALGSSYINPLFRVAEFSTDARPAEEEWWRHASVPEDAQWFLAGYLTSPTATEMPLVVLGQPGSGKSLLTKVLAARLPPDEYLPVRVELRHVPADAPLQDQIEFALREATGERMDWPELLRQAGDALAVVMLDGFDELLQSTGLSHSAFLEQVREFQQREIAQGRRVAFIVTSRIVVANRMRFPEGTAIAKLEPFDPNQIELWINSWNSANADYFRQTELQPLTIKAIGAQIELAEQPLLLLMLSFYDADGNALQQQQSQELARADLYEGLLTKFVDREIDKRNADLSKEDRNDLADIELDELSVVAFGMFNRGSKSISEEELDADLNHILPADQNSYDASSRMARPLSRAQLTIGRFFFIHRSQAELDNVRINDYEFLHSTFGEYLTARLIYKILAHFIDLNRADRPSRAVRSTSVIDDSRLWDLLSFAVLTDGSQIVPFLAELIHKFSEDQLAVLRTVLADLFRGALRPRERGYSGYEPRRYTVPARHATYSANLLVLNVSAALGGALQASLLFGSTDRAIASWRSYALLWKSQIDSADWDGLINSLSVVHVNAEPADLNITYETVRLTKPVDHFEKINWMATDTTSQIQDVGIGADRVGWQAIFLCAPELDLLMHALQPLLRISPSAFRHIVVSPGGEVESAMHIALSALIASAQLEGDPDEARKRAYESLFVWSSPQPKIELKQFLTASTAVTTASVFAAQLSDVSLVTSQQYEAVRRHNLESWLSAGMSMDPGRNRKDPFGILRLYVANYDELAKLRDALPAPLTASHVYGQIDPIALAGEDVSFIGEVVRLARINSLIDWAALQGLSLLAVLDEDKLAEIPPEEIAFVLNSSTSRPGRGTIVSLIRDRYNAAGHRKGVLPPGD